MSSKTNRHSSKHHPILTPMDNISLSVTSSFSCRYEKLLLSQKYVDCTFVIGNTSLQCHKLILSSASPVFEAMFYGPLREENSVVISDIGPETFYDMINYIYTGEIDFTQLELENTIELYYSAEKYLLSDLVTACLNAVKLKLRFENILPALDLSVYMNLEELFPICLKFFLCCCLNNLHFTRFIKSHYYHVSKDCIKAMIETNNNGKALALACFVEEWCHNEKDSLSQSRDILDLDLTNLGLDMTVIGQQEKISKANSCNLVERTYYKACRPFKIDSVNRDFSVMITTNRFITLYGIIINSRLIPPRANYKLSSDYTESVQIQISTGDEIIFNNNLNLQNVRFNCDLNLSWEDGVTLTPQMDYAIKLIWNGNAFGAEYPCSLLSNEVAGITFKDSDNISGSLVKGLRCVDTI